MSEHKKRRKVDVCHNCHTLLQPEDNFCPHCGQENHDLKVPLGHLLFEVIEGFTHLDTKLFNTLRSIFLYPGKITKDFLEGRRGRYVPPIRLYFLASFLFFLLLGNITDKALDSKSGNEFMNGFYTGASDAKGKSIKEASSALKEAKSDLNQIKNSEDTNGLYKAQKKYRKLQKALTEAEELEEDIKKDTNKWVDFVEVDASEILDEMNVQNEDTLRKLIEKLPETQQRHRLINIQKQIVLDSVNTELLSDVSSEINEYFTETIGRKNQVKYALRLHSLKNNAKIKLNYYLDTVITIQGSNGTLENKAYKQRLLKMSDNELDSLIEEREASGRDIAFLGIKALKRGFLRNITHYELAFQDDAEAAMREITHFGIGVFSLMMFILMPIVAFLLKIIYSKRTHSFFTYPIRLIYYLWDWILYLPNIRKIRKYKRIPRILEGHTRYYYEHLIFSIHIHSVLFLMVVIVVGGGVLLGYWNYAILITMTGFSFYFIAALKVVYRQRIFKTVFKSFILFFLYIISFLLILSITGAIKFALS
jgi:hypothetical protein